MLFPKLSMKMVFIASTSILAQLSFSEASNLDLSYSDEPQFQVVIKTDTDTKILGASSSATSVVKFSTDLSAPNEVAVKITFDSQPTSEPIDFSANYNLSDFTIVFDGKGAVLQRHYKLLLVNTSEQLLKKYLDPQTGNLPLHARMLIQTMSYWSKAPEGFRHIKREIQSSISR